MKRENFSGWERRGMAPWSRKVVESCQKLSKSSSHFVHGFTYFWPVYIIVIFHQLIQ